MIVRKYEGGIPYEVEVPEPNPARLASLMRAMDEHCTCRGDAHDECKPIDEDECQHRWRWSDSRNGFICLTCGEFDAAE